MQTFNEEKYHITSLKKLLEIIDEKHSPNKNDRTQFIFRGHSNHTYKLIPGVGRAYVHCKNDELEKAKKLEFQSFKQFKIQTYHITKENNNFIALAIAQHHGLKTRFLDWTFSPLVALFFAVENHPNENGSFYAYKMDKALVDVLANEDKDPFNPRLDYNYLYIPFISPRIKAQNGLFQLFKNPHIPLETEKNLEKFIIPSRSKSNIIAELFQMGITHSTMFPDLDGTAKTINYQFWG